jgi:hypothetical protein
MRYTDIAEYDTAMKRRYDHSVSIGEANIPIG